MPMTRQIEHHGRVGVFRPSSTADHYGRRGSRCSHMTSEPLHLTAVFEPVENGWVQARVPEIPGVITAAPTHDEARELLLDAVREFLLSFLSDPSDASASAAHESLTVTLSAAA